jgi:hypothetical protein
MGVKAIRMLEKRGQQKRLVLHQSFHDVLPSHFDRHSLLRRRLHPVSVPIQRCNRSWAQSVNARNIEISSGQLNCGRCPASPTLALGAGKAIIAIQKSKVLFLNLSTE